MLYINKYICLLSRCIVNEGEYFDKVSLFSMFFIETSAYEVAEYLMRKYSYSLPGKWYYDY